MKKFSKKIVLCGMSALFAAALMSCDDSGSPKSKPELPEPPSPGEHPAWIPDDIEYPYAGEDAVTAISGNMVDDGDADGTNADTYIKLVHGGESGVVCTAVEGLGVNGSKCWRVSQTGGATSEWQEFNFDLTPIYGQGKSYLISFKYKADPGVADEKDADGNPNQIYGYKSKDVALDVSYSVYSGDVKMYTAAQGLEYYDFSGDGDEIGVWGTAIKSPWSNPFSTEDVFYEGLAEALGVEPETLEINTGAAKASDNWKECNLIIPSTALEEKINNTGVYYFGLTFSMGPNAVGGYSYLLDDISIKDLNAEIEYFGRSWKDPNAAPEPEEPEEPEEGSEA